MKPRLVVLVLIFIYSVLSAYAGDFLPLRLVNGNSMEPALYAGDVILLRSVPFSDIARGDVVAYSIPDTTSTGGRPITILHRVQGAEVRNGERVLLTKGDNSTIDPWPVTSSLVRGKLAFRLPWIGKPVLFLASPLSADVIRSRAAIFSSLAPLTPLLYIPTMLAVRSIPFEKLPDALPALDASQGTPFQASDSEQKPSQTHEAS